MKISSMLKREDFYAINQKTLSEYFSSSKCENPTLFVFEKLNAIVTSRPSKQVRNYLLCEYNVTANIFKRYLVKLYVLMCLNSNGLLSDRKINLPNSLTNNMLIYPCNKKYRIFNFEHNTVDVIVKAGFPTYNIEREIEFRTKDNLPSFVPKLMFNSKYRYSERIIDGKPLARVNNNENLLKQAMDLLHTYGEKQIISGNDYALNLQKQINALIIGKQFASNVQSVFDKLCRQIRSIENLTIGFSHGDFQPGNIWIENKTGDLFIIDWESWGERSLWYDEEVLFNKLRTTSVTDYMKLSIDFPKKCTVLAEDIIYHLIDLNGLPSGIGDFHFVQYIGEINRWVDAALSD